MLIDWVGMTRAHFQAGAATRIRVLVIHATAGRAPGDLHWLRKGGDERRPVSCHYYIDKAGRIAQLVRDEDIAWHAGVSAWHVDGRDRKNLNDVSLGIELENLNSGRDPYPEEQYQATLWLARRLVEKYRIPRNQLVRHLDIAPGRKTDPAGFPWARFTDDVYTPTIGPDRLRELMREFALRSAGGSAWAFAERAAASALGMPVAMLSSTMYEPAQGAAQDDSDRAIWLPGHAPLMIEIYARDLLYAPAGGNGDQPPPPGVANRLAETEVGPLRDQLLHVLFRSADPYFGFRADWPIHRAYLADPAGIGVPIGPGRRVIVASQAYLCQHFAFDTLYAPVEHPQRVARLRDLIGGSGGLAAATRDELRRSLLSDLYHSRAGIAYDEQALFTQAAVRRHLGAPLATPEVITIGASAFLLTVYAGDVLACQLPDPAWPLERALPADTQLVSLGRNAAAVTTPDLLSAGFQEQRAPLGMRRLRPPLIDLAGTQPLHRSAEQVDSLLIWPAGGPIGADLQARGAAGWHYYLDCRGSVFRLANDRSPIRVGDRRAVVVAVEGGIPLSGPAQRMGLAWLLQALVQRHSIALDRIQTLHAADRRPTPEEVASC